MIAKRLLGALTGVVLLAGLAINNVSAQDASSFPVTVTQGSLKVGKLSPFAVPPGTILKGTVSSNKEIKIQKKNIVFAPVPYSNPFVGNLTIKILPAADATGKIGADNSVTSLALKLYVTITGGQLGDKCQIGSPAGPITLNLAGTGNVVADNSFNVPVAKDCGESESLINNFIGLPTSQGNEAKLSLQTPSTNSDGGGSVVSSVADLRIEEGDTAKKTVKLSLSEAPKSAVTLKVVSPAEDSTVIGLDTRTVVIGTDNKPVSVGVTLGSGAAKGKYETVKLEGAAGNAKYVGSFKVTVTEKGSTVGNNVTKNEIIKPSDIDPKDLPGTSITSVGSLLPKLIGWFLTLIALGAFISLLYSGFMYITASGDTGKAELARKNITWALTGIIITLLSYTVVSFVGNWTSQLGGGGSETGGGNTDTGQLLVSSTGGGKLTEVQIADVSLPVTVDVFVRLGAKPTSPVVVRAGVEGSLPLALSTDQLTFAVEDWNKDQLLSVVYAGNGQTGDGARLVLRLNDQLAYSVPFKTGAASLPSFWVSDDELKEITEYTIGDPKTQVSIELRGLVDNEPGDNGVITITSTGEFTLTASPGTLTFTDDNWSLSQPFGISYGGDGSSGQTATLNFSAGSTVIHSIKFIIP